MGISWPLLFRKVQGHSMLPILPPGTLVVGWRWFAKPKLDRVAIFNLQGREVVKRIARIEDDGLFIVGDHTEASTDSRQYGLVPYAEMIAVVILPRTKKVSGEFQTSPDK